MKTIKKGNGFLMSQVIFCPNDNGSNSHENPSFDQLSDNEFECKKCGTVLVVKESDVNLDRNWRLRIEVYIEEKKGVTLYTSWKGKENFEQGKAFEACTETVRAHMLEIKVSEKHIQHKQGNMRVISIGSDTVFV